MKSEDWTIAQSVAAWQIVAFCRDVCQEVGLDMVNASWERGFNPHCANAPYHLLVHTTVGAQDWWFTVEEIAEYPAPAVVAKVQSPIRAGLADLAAAQARLLPRQP